jgi:hypothetical protein
MNAKKRPEHAIANDISIWENFSPTPFWIAKHFLISLAASS